MNHRTSLRCVMACAAAALPTITLASDLPPAVVASFTQRVQPLVLNRCAAGACHGGPDSPAPRFRRAATGAQPDRQHTRANLTALLEAIGPDRDPRPLSAFLAADHPQPRGGSSRRTTALTTPERATLDRWLADVRTAEQPAAPTTTRDLDVVPASAEVDVANTAPQPNRFRALLDAAANAPELPPPEEPRGLIFKSDEPPAE